MNNSPDGTAYGAEPSDVEAIVTSELEAFTDPLERYHRAGAAEALHREAAQRFALERARALMDMNDDGLSYQQIAEATLIGTRGRVQQLVEKARKAAPTGREPVHHPQPKPSNTSTKEPVMTSTPRLVWSVVRGTSPGSNAVEPGPYDIEIPDQVLDWAAGHGLSVDDSDVYLLVTPDDEAGEVIGEIAYLTVDTDEATEQSVRDALARQSQVL